MKLRIASDVALPDEAITETFAILGIRGSGKTNTAVVMAEEMMKAQQQIAVLDPTDAWYGLRSSSDGKSEGFKIIIAGGDHADIPLEGVNGHTMAEFVVETGASIVFSLRHLSMNDQRRFAQDFAERLYDLKGKNRSPLHLFVDEADEFIPQRIPHGFERMFGAYDRLVRRGRIAGVGVTMISQRPQVINKDTLSQIGILICMRLMHKLDRKSVKESWVEGHDVLGKTEEFMDSLASLDRGEAWIWGTTYLDIFRRVSIRHRETFDSSFTPKAGDRPKEMTARAEVDLEALKKRLSATIEKAKADDPRELRRKISDLEKQLARKQELPPETRAIEKALSTAKAEWKSKLENLRGILSAIRSTAESVVTAFATPVELIEDAIKNISDDTMKLEQTMRYYEEGRRLTPTMPFTQKPVERTEEGKLRAGAERMLAALAQWSPAGMDVNQMRAHAGMKKSGTFSTYMSDLRRGGYIEERNGEVYATGKGLEYCKHVPSAPATTEDVLNVWRPKLRDGARRMLDVLVVAGGEFMEREELAEASGLTQSGTFTTYLSDLRTARLVVTNSQGVAANRETLFL